MRAVASELTRPDAHPELHWVVTSSAQSSPLLRAVSVPDARTMMANHPQALPLRRMSFRPFPFTVAFPVACHCCYCSDDLQIVALLDRFQWS